MGDELTRNERDLFMEWAEEIDSDPQARADDIETAHHFRRYEATVRDLEGIIRRLESSLASSERRAAAQ